MLRIPDRYFCGSSFLYFKNKQTDLKHAFAGAMPNDPGIVASSCGREAEVLHRHVITGFHRSEVTVFHHHHILDLFHRSLKAVRWRNDSHLSPI